LNRIAAQLDPVRVLRPSSLSLSAIAFIDSQFALSFSNNGAINTYALQGIVTIRAGDLLLSRSNLAIARMDKQLKIDVVAIDVNDTSA
jgi:hypothetical protein